MRKSLIIILLILFDTSLFSQNIKDSSVPYENIFLYTDRDLYISGENIWFSSFCLTDGKFSENFLSKIMYVELFDKQGKTIVYQKLKIFNGNSSSLIRIPVDIETGVYNLIVYTQFMKNYNNFKSNKVSLVIINPEKNADTKLTDKNKTDINDSFADNNVNRLKISSDKEIYNTREEVKIKIRDDVFPEKLKFATVSVIKKGSLNDILLSEKNKINKLSINNIKFYPEIRDLTITGSLINKKTSQAIPNQKMYVSVLNNNRQIDINKTDKKGNFIFTLNSLFNLNNILIRTENNIPNSEILINNNFSNKFKRFKSVQWNIDSSKIEVIKDLYENYQVNESFKKDNIVENSKFNKSFDFFNDEEIVINTKDFIVLPTIEEIFNEIIPLVHVEKRNNHSFISIYDDINKTTYNNPLILYDNVPVFNFDKLLKINPKYIKQIKVITRRYIIGNYIFNGVVFIKSKLGTFPGLKLNGNYKIINYQSCSKSFSPIFPTYPKKNNSDKHIPDFRNTLYWNPTINFSESEYINFYTSDYCGEYEIIIRGFSSSGELYFGSHQINVQKK